MKRKILTLIVALAVIFSLITVKTSAGPSTICPDCGSTGYYAKCVTYNYGFVAFVPCIHGEIHNDTKYYIWQYSYNECSECGYTSSRRYYEGYYYCCPGEPIPNLPPPVEP